MNWLNEKNLGTAPDNPSMGDMNDITASTQENTKSDTEEFRKFYGAYHKSVAVIQFFIQLSQHKIYITHTHTLLIAQIQIRRECPLFIRGFSNWAFFTSLTERQNKQSDAQWHARQWQQDWWRIILKGENEVELGTNEEQY